MKRIACRIALALFAVIALGNASAATYYVNSNGGNDFNTGTAATANGASVGPWQTLAKLANTSLLPGDTIYLACGSVWNETLQLRSSGTAAAPIYVTAGPGTCATMPMIDGAVSIPSHAWTKHSGSIYRATLPVDLVSNPSQPPAASGWSPWSATGDSSMILDPACPGQAVPCMAFTSGSSNSIASSNTFPIVGGEDYTVGIQVRAPAGAQVKVVLRRAGPTFEKLAPDQWLTGVGSAWQSVGFLLKASVSVPNARLDIEVATASTRINLREAHVIPSMVTGSVLSPYIDGLPIRRAHHPNFGYAGAANSPYATVNSSGGKTILETSGLQLPAGATITPGLGVTIRTTDWSIEERNVSGFGGTRITLSSPTDYDIQAGYGFFLTGALWMLDSPGEWFFDADSKTLYVWMPDSTSPGNRISVNGISTGVDLATKSNIALSRVTIRHVGTGVLLNRSTDVSLSTVTVSDVSDYGVRGENCVRCRLSGMNVARTGLDAISVVGPMATSLSVADSAISDSGASQRTDGWRMLPRPAFGAIYSVGPSTTLSRNRITGAAKIGLYAGPGAVISNNYINQSCLILNDCGAIYAGRIGNGSSISGNVVENVAGNVFGVPSILQVRSVGIYLDDHNTNSTVTGNSVSGAEYGMQIHNASGATVSNNVLFGNRKHQLWIHENSNQLRAAGDVFGNSINSNMMVPTASGPAVYLLSEYGETTHFASFNGNHYSALLSQRVIGEQSPSSGASYSVAEWQAIGRESNALVTQPVGYASFLAGASNLVPNGALASGIVGWTSWNESAPLSTAAVFQCGSVPCIEMQAGGSPTLLTSPNFSVTGGQWYRVTFDASTSQEGQAINAVVRRGGGGTAGYEFLMSSAESFTGSTAWRRYSFTFQASKTVIAGNPATGGERGARVDFERNQPGTKLRVARLEMVTLSPAQAALQIKLLLNRYSSVANIDCATLGVSQALCSSFVHMGEDSSVVWPTQISSLSSRPVYTRDTSLTDTDQDGIADQQDYCANTSPGLAVNSRGCAINQ